LGKKNKREKSKRATREKRFQKVRYVNEGGSEKKIQSFIDPRKKLKISISKRQNLFSSFD
jgi:hypothetical protein